MRFEATPKTLGKKDKAERTAGLFIQQLQNNGKSSVPLAQSLVSHLKLLKIRAEAAG